MRQIGQIVNPRDAVRFVDYLESLGIDAETEEDGAIWVRDEDQLLSARDALLAFQSNPADSRYDEARNLAETRRREARKQAAQASERVVEMRDQWQRSPRRRSPVVTTVIILSVVTYLLTNGGSGLNEILRDMLFCQVDAQLNVPADGWQQIRQGQVWRLVTPAFIHFGLTHLIFNLLALQSFGSLIENNRGSVRLGLLVLGLAVVSNIAQYQWTHSPMFGGISCVVFGLFGYCWAHTRMRPDSSMALSNESILVMFAFFWLCILSDFEAFSGTLGYFLPKVANAGHAAGLIAGSLWGFRDASRLS